MSHKHLGPFSRQVTIVVGLTVVGFMAFGLALSFYRNVLFQKTLENLADKNAELQYSIEENERELEYYRSDQYKDKYAKENLGRVTPGEKVLIITQDHDADELLDDIDTLALQEQQEAAFLELVQQMPVLDQWKMYLFHRKEMEELKRSFMQ